MELAVKEGYNVDLYSNNGSGFLSDINGVSYFKNHYYRSNFRILTLISFFFSQLIILFPLYLRYRKIKPVFYVNTILPFGGILVGRFLGLKVVTHVHEFEIKPKRFNDFLFEIVSRYSSKIVVVSEFLKSNPYLQNSDVEVIYNCVSLSFSENARERTVPNKKLNVLMLASLRPYKGIYEFIKLSKNLPQVTFTLVVSDSQSEVDGFIKKNDIPINFQLVAVQKDVHPFYRNADLIVNLSRPEEWIETFGMTILEGMYYGLPAIVPTVGGITELVDHGVNGFQISCENLNDIENKIQLLANDPSEWQRLNKNVLIFKQRFSRVAFKDKMKGFLSAITI